jgi:hypothetical protein
MPRLGRGGAAPAPQGKVEARTPEAAVSGFTGRGVGVGDDRGKCTPNFVHPFRLSAPPSFHFCPGLPLSCCGHLKVHHPGFCPVPHLSVSSSYLLSAAPAPAPACPLAFPGLYPFLPYPEPDGTPLRSPLLQHLCFRVPFLFLFLPPVMSPPSLLSAFPLSACVVLQPPTPHQPIPKTLHSFPQILSFLVFVF